MNARTERIRRAAILVASLDEALASQMLAALPPQDAARVSAAVDRLDEVDAQELADVLEEFRGVSRSSRTASDAVEFTYSAPVAGSERGRESFPTESQTSEQRRQSEKTPDLVAEIADAEIAAMVELLVNEQPQTIAAALSRMDHDRGAAAFAALPAALQPEVLERIATLEVADEDALSEVESQLMRRVDEHRQRRRQAAVGVELARRIIAKTSPADQSVLLRRLAAGRAGSSAVATSRSENRRGLAQIAHSAEQIVPSPLSAPNEILAEQAQDLASAVRLARQGTLIRQFESGGFDDATAQLAPVAIEDLSSALDALSDEALLMALRNADELVAHRALAASSEALLRRITSKLSRRQARVLRKRLRAMGPTRLAELRQAQFELLQLANSQEVNRRAAVAA